MATAVVSSDLGPVPTMRTFKGDVMSGYIVACWLSCPLHPHKVSHWTDEGIRPQFAPHDTSTYGGKMVNAAGPQKIEGSGKGKLHSDLLLPISMGLPGVGVRRELHFKNLSCH